MELSKHDYQVRQPLLSLLDRDELVLKRDHAIAVRERGKCCAATDGIGER
jgi:hypothetical protein